MRIEHPIPQEMVDSIIDFLHDDIISLVACSLAARPFLPETRHHLFSKITLTTENISSFVMLLENSSPHTMASSVHTVILERSYHPWPIEAIDRLAAQLRAVKCLRFLHVDLLSFERHAPDKRSRRPILELITRLGSVEELELEKVHFESIDQLIDLAYASPKLKWLSLGSLNAHGSMRLPIATHLEEGPCFSLRCLKLRDKPEISENVTKWIMSRNPVPPVLEIVCSASDLENSTLQEFTRRVGGSVMRLQIEDIAGDDEIIS